MELDMQDKTNRESSSRLVIIALALLVVLTVLTLFLMNLNHAYAENAVPDAADSDSALAVQSEDVLEGGLLVVSEDGVSRYSTDGGISWIEGYPEGAEVQTDAQGRTTVSIGEVPDGAAAFETDSLGVGVNDSGDGVIRYTTDGGATWSEQVPDGVTVTEGPDGKVTVSSEGGPILAQQGGTDAG
jgi:photosystem II stability/assembly factor-like uncharacterized protein